MSSPATRAADRGLAGHITESSAEAEGDRLTFPRRNVAAALQDVPIVQWANGHTKARGAPEERFGPFVGFHAEMGKDESLDDMLGSAGLPTIEIRHQRQGSFEVKPHWNLGEALRFHPITAGPAATTISGCLRAPETTAVAGLGLSWPANEKSRLAVRGMLIVEGGGALLVQLAVRSTMTNFLLAALLDHARVCAAADALVDRAKHPEEVALHELALPLRAGPEQAAGKGETTAQIVPFVSGHPAEPDREYIKAYWRPSSLHEAALHAWPGIVVWANEYRSEGGEGNG